LPRSDWQAGLTYWNFLKKNIVYWYAVLSLSWKVRIILNVYLSVCVTFNILIDRQQTLNAYVQVCSNFHKAPTLSGVNLIQIDLKIQIRFVYFNNFFVQLIGGYKIWMGKKLGIFRHFWRHLWVFSDPTSNKWKVISKIVILNIFSRKNFQIF
jgi:hypothetical protein